jgi:hypothetical protein
VTAVEEQWPGIDVSRHRQLSLCVIGPGTDWDSTYRLALQRLGPRAVVVAATGPSLRATSESFHSLGATTSASIRGLLRLATDGVLCPDSQWYGWYPLVAAIETGRNFYGQLPDELDAVRLANLFASTQSGGLLIVPELRLRYTPATLRLRELQATELGPISEIEVRSVNAGTPASDRVLRELIDWCRVVVGGAPYSVRCQLDEACRTTQQLVVTLSFSSSGHDFPIRAVLRLPLHNRGGQSSSPVRHAPADAWPLEFSLSCKHGEARLEDTMHLRWRAGGQERIESLSAERTAVCVALDHFARRLAGGLIPVPSLADVLEAHRITQLVHASRAGGGCETACRER